MLNQAISKLYKLSLCALFLLGGGSVGLAAESVRVVAWNIEWFPGQEFRDVTREMEVRHMERTQETIKELNPDLLLGSEIRNWKFFDELLEVVPDLKVAVVSAFRDRDFGQLWRQQVTIASKLPILVAWYEDWKSTIPALTRGFSFAAIEWPGEDGKVVLVYSLHLKSNRARTDEMTQTNYRVRDESIVQLLQHVDEMKRITFKDNIAGVIIGGDFNTNEDGQFGDNVIQMMLDAGYHSTWSGVAREDRLTWRGSDRYEATTFDYIFTKGLPEVTASLFWVPAEHSDHQAVVVEIPVRTE